MVERGKIDEMDNYHENCHIQFGIEFHLFRFHSDNGMFLRIENTADLWHEDSGIHLCFEHHHNGTTLRIRTKSEEVDRKIAVVNQHTKTCHGWLHIGGPTKRIIFETEFFAVLRDRHQKIQKHANFAIGFRCMKDMGRIKLTKEVDGQLNTGEFTYLLFRRLLFIDHAIRLRRYVMNVEYTLNSKFEDAVFRAPDNWPLSSVKRHRAMYKEISEKIQKWITLHPELAVQVGSNSRHDTQRAIVQAQKPVSNEISTASDSVQESIRHPHERPQVRNVPSTPNVTPKRGPPIATVLNVIPSELELRMSPIKNDFTAVSSVIIAPNTISDVQTWKKHIKNVDLIWYSHE